MRAEALQLWVTSRELIPRITRKDWIKNVLTGLDESVLLIDASRQLSAYKSFAVWTCTAQCVDDITLIDKQANTKQKKHRLQVWPFKTCY